MVIKQKMLSILPEKIILSALTENRVEQMAPTDNWYQALLTPPD